MPNITIGDMSRHYLTMSNTTRIKTALGQLSEELSTGQASDLTRHLKGDRGQLGAIDRELSKLTAFRQVATAASQRLEAMQLHVERIDQARASLATDLMPINSQSPANRLDAVAQTASDSFRSIAGALNGRFGDRALFAGRSTDAPALAVAETMLSDLRTLLAGSVDASDAEGRIRAYFEDPSGGFTTSAYLGDTGPAATIQLGDGDSVTQSVRADDAGFRRLLGATAMVALSGDPALGFTGSTRIALIESGRAGLLTNATAIAGLQARIGTNQAEIETSLSTTAARMTVNTIQRNDLTSVDQFEVATRLQSVQQQLEMHFTMTARLSRLTLSEYLR